MTWQQPGHHKVPKGRMPPRGHEVHARGRNLNCFGGQRGEHPAARRARLQTITRGTFRTTGDQ